MKFTIDRSKWRFGGDSYNLINLFGDTLLCNAADFMCCLGHVSLQLGIPKEAICGIASPDTLLFKLVGQQLTEEDRQSITAVNAVDRLQPLLQPLQPAVSEERIAEIRQSSHANNYKILAHVINARCNNSLAVDLTRLARDAIEINDDGYCSTDKREQRLIALFAQHGHELEFTGDYNPEMLRETICD